MPVAPPRRRAMDALLFGTPLLLAAVAVAGVPLAFPFRFPVPWNDETQFIARGFSLARHGTLLVPGLDPDRPMMEMPPGYLLVLAAVFRVLGYGYGTARAVSTACTLGALALLGAIAWRAPAGWRRPAGALAVALAFASPATLLSSDVARMEALLLLLACAALAAGLAGRLYAMGAIVALAGTVHFNAVYLLPGVAIAFGLRAARDRRIPAPGPGGLAAVAAAGLAWLGYAALIASHWRGFRLDMGAQFAIKRAAAGADPTQPAALLYGAAALGVAAAVGARLAPGPVLLAAFGTGLVAMTHLGGETWYDYGDPVGAALLTLGALAAAPDPARPRAAAAAAALAGACLLGTALMAARVTPQLAPFLPRRAALGRPFLPAGEIGRVRRFVATLPPGRTIEFGFTGDENFFLDSLDRAGVGWTRAYRSFFVARPWRHGDWVVSCDSADLAPSMLTLEGLGDRSVVRRRGADTGCTIVRRAPGPGEGSALAPP